MTWLFAMIATVFAGMAALQDMVYTFGRWFGGKPPNWFEPLPNAGTFVYAALALLLWIEVKKAGRT